MSKDVLLWEQVRLKYFICETFIIISSEIFLAEVLIISIIKLFPKRMN